MNNGIKLPYDDTNPKDIFKYSQDLLGLNFIDILSRVFENQELKDKIDYYNNPKGKGTLGNLLEEYYFCYKPNSSPEPDFEKAGVELKATPYEKNSKGLKAGERLVITMIPNTEAIEINFKGSHLEKKISKILMIWYHRIRNQKRTEHSIDYVNLYDIYSDICAKDLEIILDDYRIIVNKIISGNAHKLSESDTKYLGACTKGSTAAKSLKPQYYNKNIPAKRRAFSLKQSYMTYVLNNYVQPGLMNYDSIFNEEDLKDGDFDNKILSKINRYIGKDTEELYKLFNISVDSKSKHINKILVNRMLGVNTDNSEEFQKAGIIIKTIRVKKTGIPKESMSFPKIRILDFIQQDFENSYEYEFFETTRFLFVVFRENENGKFILSGSKFWNMPIEELESIGKSEWNNYKNKFISGINFKIKNLSCGKQIIANDLPKKTDTQIFHLRPHSIKSAYLISGKRYGNGSDADMDLLPNGDKMTHQCFWLNNNYISKIIKDI